MKRAYIIGVFLFAGVVFHTRAQSIQLTTLQNSNLCFASADLTTNGVPGLTNTAPDLMVSAVSPASANQGSVSLVTTQAWARGYDGPTHGDDFPSDVVVDGQNIIVTGVSPASTSGYDILTIKYAGDGTPLWTNRWDGPAHLNESVGYLAVDASGNVYVTGTSEGTSTTCDVVTIKYSPDGNLLWVNRYNRYGTNYCGASGLAVDKAENVFVSAGISYADTAFITIKYDPQGNAVWTNYYKGSTNGTDWLAAMAVDKAGNIFVTGDSDGVGTGLNYATLKYAPDGTALWTNRYINGWTAIPSAMTLDPDGNVIVTGDSFLWNLSWIHTYATVKYSSDGIPLWTNLVPAANYQGGSVPRVVTDTAGNIFLTGGSPDADATNANFTTVKLSASSVPLWTNSFFATNFDSSSPVTTAVDSAGNFYFAGHSGGPGGTNVDFVTIKYDAAGNAIWTNRYGGFNSNSWNEASGIAVDQAGNAYVTGGSGSYWSLCDFATVKYTDYIRYTPPMDFTGTDSFTFTAVGPFGNSATGIVTVVVLPANLQFNTDPANLWYNAEGMHLQVEGARGTNAVIIYASTNLLNWEPIFTNQPEQGSIQFTDRAVTNTLCRFYRAIQPQ